ncbi:MAG: glucosaminidase domain-containing protein [Firmicutes bacterium]|nr:glucosaminidase domain-containing protein [Bacillota bacterium]
MRKADDGTTYSKFSSVRTVCTKYKITGTSDITAKRLAKYFKKSGHKYPKYYKKTDAKTLTEFCKIYVEEARAEGIRGEVAFVQAMLETGWLTYRGSVKRSQHNFAGLGATGGGKRGLSFKSVRVGVRAQVQHLKAYANKKDLNKKCVDKRFKYVARGCAPYVEWLGMQENPKGQGWAASAGYGKGLLKMLAKI